MPNFSLLRNSKINGVPYAFLYYYVPTRYFNDWTLSFTSEVRDFQHHTWNFKDGTDQEWAVKAVCEVLQALDFSGKNNADLVLACIPASTREANQRRYAWFSQAVCQNLNLQNAFEHISIIKEKEPKHITGIESDTVLEFDESFFAGKDVILFDDVVTKGHSMQRFMHQLRLQDARPVLCFSLGNTYFPPRTTDNPVNPYTGNHLLLSSVSNTTTSSTNTDKTPTSSVTFSTSNVTSAITSATANGDSSGSASSITVPIPASEPATVITVVEPVVTKDVVAPSEQQSSPVSNSVIKPANKSESKDVISTRATSKQCGSTLKKGDTLTMGSFYGKPLVWEVLSCDSADGVLIISKYGITCRAYNKNDELTSWEKCSLRQWLNGAFFNRSFTDNEKSRIITSQVNAEVVAGHELNPGRDTKDNIYILSINEYLRYYGDTNHWRCFLLDAPRTKRQCWLRNYGADRGRAAFIGRSGRIHEGGSLVTSSRNTIRPVMLIKG